MEPALHAAATSAVPPTPREWVAQVPGPILRDITRGALASIAGGVLVGGLGGRLVMRAATLLDPDATGRITENGNRIGDITVGGTLALIFFGGMFSGLIAAVTWTAVSPWLPNTGVRRGLWTALVAMAVAGFLLVEADNPDFRILDADAIVITMLLGLIAVFGFTLSLLDERLERRLPRVTPTRLGLAVAYLGPVLFGAVFVLPAAVGTYFSPDFCFCARPAVPVGAALAMAGAATVVWWVLRARRVSEPPAWLTVIGRVALVAAVALGSLRLAEEIIEIVALP